MRRPLALALMLALAPLAGCLGAAEEPASEGATPAGAATPSPAAQSAADNASAETPRAGSLVVVARMPDASLLPRVNVSVGNESRLTDDEGVARFDALPTGSVEVVARKEAHRTARVAVDILAGREARTEVVLAAEGNDQHAHEDGVFAHRDLYTFEGHFDCSATYVIVTGDCLLLVHNVTTTAGLPSPDGQTQERHLIDFPLDVNWTSLVVEMTWSAALPTPATGEGMTLALEPAEAPADGHAAKYARAVGGSPLRVELAPGAQHETATTGDMPNPSGGEVIRARAYVMGAAHNPGGTNFLGVGAAAQHDFTLYVSIFYGEAAPAGYSAIGGA